VTRRCVSGSAEARARRSGTRLVLSEVDGVRFWARVDTTGDCWEWRGARHQNGYGRFSMGGKSRFAHRIAWTLTHGPIPTGLDVCHHCDNPPCVNPAHLFVGTGADNLRDARDKGRLRPRAGEAHPQAKLTAEQVATIRARCAAGEAQRAVAREFRISQPRVCQIVRGHGWARMTAHGTAAA